MSNKLKVVDLGAGISQVRRKTATWLLPANAPRTIDDLNFTSRDETGSLNRWDVTPTKTDYWSVHQQHGRALAFEFLDLLHNPDGEDIHEHTFGLIASEIVSQPMPMADKMRTDGIYIGFFELISEYLINGRVDR